MSQLARQLIAENKRSKAKRLDIGNCGLTDLNEIPELFDCVWLEELVVSNEWLENPNDLFLKNSQNKGGRNELEHIPEKITHLKSLKGLWMGTWRGRWKISDASFLSGLTGLQSLDLSSNQISDANFLEELLKRGKMEVSLEEYDFVGKINLHDNPLKNPPIEIVKQGREAILNYFEELEGGSETVYEAKLLIIGQAGVGKTSFKTRFVDVNAPLPDEEADTTVGIDISQYIFDAKGDDPEFTMNIWDFGGQAVYHSTHQFFLSKRSLYVLVDDGRTEDHNRYWLQIQELFGKDSPLLILVNQKGTIQRHIALNQVKAEFPNVQDLHAINLQKDLLKIEVYRKTIEFHIRNLPQFRDGETLPKKWVQIRADLEEMRTKDKRNHISLQEYRAVCENRGMMAIDRQDYLIDYLHDLGVLLHFRDQRYSLLQRIVILRPEWATKAVYAILNHTEQNGNNGEFTYQDLQKVWSGKEYCHLLEELLALMQKFELCYQLPHDATRFVVPQLLPKDQPKYAWEEGDKLQMRYEYGFMPKGIVTRLIVRLHQYIEHPNPIVWQQGVVLQYENTRAEVVEEYRNAAIRIQVQGKHPQRFMPIILKELDEINSTFHFNERMEVEKLVPCICAVCQKKSLPELHAYQDLMDNLEIGEHRYYCNKGRDFFDIYEALENIGVEKRGIEIGGKRNPEIIETPFTPEPKPKPPKEEPKPKKRNWVFLLMAFFVLIGALTYCFYSPNNSGYVLTTSFILMGCLIYCYFHPDKWMYLAMPITAVVLSILAKVT